MDPYVSADSISTMTTRWLEKIDPSNQHVMSLNQEKCALLVIDMQEFFTGEPVPSGT